MILSRTPFRLPLGGGGTDLPSYYSKHEGFLITAAVNKYMYITVNLPAIVDRIKVNYSKVENVGLDEVELIRHDIVREVLKHLDLHIPMEISSMADLAAGTGMGSSSSYTVGLLKALNTMKRRYLSIRDLAEEACTVEIDRIGKPIGKQDQYAAAYGGLIQLEIDRGGHVTVTPLDLDHEFVRELENHLMMFYTSIERDANVILGEQSRKITESADAPAQTAQPVRTATEAMHRIKAIGYSVKDALLAGDVTAFGRLMHEHWEVKKSVSTKMSNPQIDEWYTIAMNNGALGGKIMGAGGGGFLLLCSENGNRKHLRRTMESAGLKYMDFRFDWEGAKVLVNI